jgi:hypothetical protein
LDVYSGELVGEKLVECKFKKCYFIPINFTGQYMRKTIKDIRASREVNSTNVLELISEWKDSLPDILVTAPTRHGGSESLTLKTMRANSASESERDWMEFDYACENYLQARLMARDPALNCTALLYEREEEIKKGLQILLRQHHEGVSAVRMDPAVIFAVAEKFFSAIEQKLEETLKAVPSVGAEAGSSAYL